MHVDVQHLTSVHSFLRDVTTSRHQLLMLWPSAPDVTWLQVNMQVTAKAKRLTKLQTRLIAQQVVVSVCRMGHEHYGHYDQRHF